MLPALRRIGRDLEIRVTSAPGHGEQLAREAVQDGFRTVVAAGGDGTVNEVLAGIGCADVRLGVLPLGTMNVFAREHRLPLDWEDALGRILRGTGKRVDLGLANGLPFAQLAGVGFDARVIEGVSSESKRAWGAGAYVFSALREMRREQTTVRVIVEGIPVREVEWVLIGLGRFYGGALPVFPRARPGDGLLDVLLVRRLEGLRSLGYLLGIPLGLHTRMPGVEYMQTGRVRIEGESGWELDGEFRGRGRVEFGIRPAALHLAA